MWERSLGRRLRRASIGIACSFLALAGCWAAEPEVTPEARDALPPLDEIWLSLGGETFRLEVADDPASRFRGLSQRRELPANSGMLFVLPRSQPFSMVMRDCPGPIDVAFLDDEARVVVVHEMSAEPPRAEAEAPDAYERRLPQYPSRVPVRFAIETAGGRLKQIGLTAGDRLALDVEALTARAR
jgi:uncharacterized membrane protein (UPF0127 family)